MMPGILTQRIVQHKKRLEKALAKIKERQYALLREEGDIRRELNSLMIDAEYLKTQRRYSFK